MSIKLRTVVPAVWLAVAACGVGAQPSDAASGAQGAASGASIGVPAKATSGMQSGQVSRTGYRSAFDGYQSLTEQPVGSWREANEQVGRIGGWQSYAREGQGGAVAGSFAAPEFKGMPGMPSMSGMPADHGGMRTRPSGRGIAAPMSSAATGSGASPAGAAPPGGAAASSAYPKPATSRAAAPTLKPSGDTKQKAP